MCNNNKGHSRQHINHIHNTWKTLIIANCMYFCMHIQELCMQLRAQGVCCLAGSLPTAMSLLGELITTSRVPDLNRCRSLCGIPASISRKKRPRRGIIAPIAMSTQAQGSNRTSDGPHNCQCPPIMDIFPSTGWVRGSGFQLDESWSG